MTMVRPRVFERLSHTIRAWGSRMPPGAELTMILMTCGGSLCAFAGARANKTNAKTTPSERITSSRISRECPEAVRERQAADAASGPGDLAVDGLVLGAAGRL